MARKPEELAVFPAQPVQRPRQQVENQIRQVILDGAIKEGDRLPSEHKLAESFNVSRTTIREALRSLAESGLLVKGPGATSGLYVQHVDHRTLSRMLSERLLNTLDVGSITPEEVAVFRDLLEVPSARHAARHRTDGHLKALHDIIDEEREITVEDPRVPELNARFHAEVAKASGNRVLSAFVSALHRVAKPLAFVATDEEFGREAVKHHINIYRAIDNQDEGAAAAAMRDHLAFLADHAKNNGIQVH
jgi:GntR family transcriptional regulator, transcriptional repressor for pyruvate dehydrogenase complex